MASDQGFLPEPTADKFALGEEVSDCWVLAWTSKRCMVGGRWFALRTLAVCALLGIALQLLLPH